MAATASGVNKHCDRVSVEQGQLPPADATLLKLLRACVGWGLWCLHMLEARGWLVSGPLCVPMVTAVSCCPPLCMPHTHTHAGVSFLPYDCGSYKQTPYEKVRCTQSSL